MCPGKGVIFLHILPVLSVLTPFAAALLLGLLRKQKIQTIKILASLGAFITLVIVTFQAVYVLKAGNLSSGLSFLPAPLTLSLGADPLSVFIALIFAFCFFMAFIYSNGYIDHSHAPRRYFTLLSMTEGAMLGVLLSTTLLGLFVFFEVMAVTIYVLVIHEEDEEAMFAGSKYLFLTVAGGLAVFFGLVLTFFAAGRIDFVPGGYIESSPLAMYALVAFLIGFGVKAGMVPLHIWLPDAHPAAPSPFSALLSGCSIKIGAYGIIRVMYYVYGMDTVRVLGFDRILLLLAVITMLFGSAMALQQDHLKRRLAYSSVAQIGYVLLGISLLSRQAMYGALFHIFAHAMMKSTLFLCAGAIIVQTGNKYISKMRGIGYRMPVTMFSFALVAMTMVGMPPFVAFISKWHLATGALETGRPLLVGVLIVSSILNALYYFPIVISAFFPDRADKKPMVVDKVATGMLFSTALMASCCLVFSFANPNWIMILAERITTSLF